MLFRSLLNRSYGPIKICLWAAFGPGAGFWTPLLYTIPLLMLLRLYTDVTQTNISPLLPDSALDLKSDTDERFH